MGFKDDWAHATPYLLFCVGVFACGDLIFGTDTSTFGSLQALPSWLNHFGDTTVNGKPALSTYAKSIANSVMFIGRLLGCTTFEPVVERTGFKVLILLIAVLQVVAVIVQLTAKSWQVFTVGRVIAYLAVGYIENTVPVYSAEVAPAALRGFCAGLLTPVITMSSVWGAGMCQAYATETGKIGWMVPVGVQAIPAVMLFILVPFTVESPRWLLTHGKKEAAVAALTRLRRREASESGQVAAEIEAIYQAVEFDKENATARWRDLCHGNYLRRAIYSALLFWFYQTTGNSFYNAYGPTFFVSVGLGSKSFTYATVVQLVGAIGAFMAIFLTDRVGRRPLILTGGTLLILFNSLIAGFGSSSVRTDATNNIVVASFILMLWSTKISWATHCYMVSSELGGIRMRKKIMMVGTTVDLFAAWLVSFTSPYIMNAPYGNIGGRIGFVWAGMAVLALIFGIFWVPELRGRSLEEVDELFETPKWGWQFAKVKTSGVGAAIARLEGGERVDNVSKMQDHEDVEAARWDHKGESAHVEDVERKN